MVKKVCDRPACASASTSDGRPVMVPPAVSIAPACSQQLAHQPGGAGRGILVDGGVDRADQEAHPNGRSIQYGSSGVLLMRMPMVVTQYPATSLNSSTVMARPSVDGAAALGLPSHLDPARVPGCRAGAWAAAPGAR
jgi:hypothetical protein